MFGSVLYATDASSALGHHSILFFPMMETLVGLRR